MPYQAVYARRSQDAFLARVRATYRMAEGSLDGNGVPKTINNVTG